MLVDIPGRKDQIEVTEREMKILYALQAFGPLTRRSLAARLGGIETEWGVNATLGKLKRAGLANITTGSDGAWVITSDGLFAVAQYLPPAMRGTP